MRCEFVKIDSVKNLWRCWRPDCGRETVSLQTDGSRIHAACRSALPPPPLGAGSELSRMLKWLGQQETKSCGCKRKARLMNERGPEWCSKNEIVIVGWMQAEAKQRKVMFWPRVALALVRLAIWKARYNRSRYRWVARLKQEQVRERERCLTKTAFT